MRRSSPNIYTILITRTGGLPITLSINPAPILVLLAIALASPVFWLGSRVYLLHRQNKELADRNQALNQAANDVFKEIEVLDAEISTLRERAGLTDDERTTPLESDVIQPQSRSLQDPQGGVSVPLDAAEAFQVAKGKLPKLALTLDQQVKPALNETLALEFEKADAKPSIRPVQDALDISSRFGVRPNPFGWGYEIHNGIDFPGPVGSPIYATAPGTITKAEWGGGYGYHVTIDHGYGYETLYAHLSALNVESGDQIKRSDVLGLLGNTGRSTGPHLHYSVYKEGQLVDPEEYLD
ncbi:MAG: peptidoglycan DD-metalloendopeptidase family protein [Merismopedia sp. SIO2A8]|nr:peptidoglycan DD-metalloendopeptidase family protein [Merismopedia sp. SIO2A8]